MKKVAVFLSIMLGLLVITGLPDADALDLPVNTSIELDLDNWTRLYDNGVPHPAGGTPVLGLESKAFLKFSDISETFGPGGFELPIFWYGGLDGEYLYGWERNVEISLIVPQADGSVNLYFDHMTFDPADPRFWEVEIYLTGITTSDYLTDPNYIPAGPANFDTIAGNIATNPTSSLFVRGRFADSIYYDTALDAPVVAAVLINVPSPGIVGGEWVNQVTLPYLLGVNAFVDVDPTAGIGGTFTGGFYGYGPDGSEYDLAIQNVRLFSETDDYGWIISDDGVRGGTFEEPDGGVCRVTGGGWDDILAVTIPPPAGQASITSNGKGKPVYSFGGQVGAPSASSIPPWGEWQHSFGKGRGPNGESFSFHGGTSSSPRGTPGTQIITVTCDDTGWCFPAREAPFHSIYIDGCGTFTNARNVDFEVGKVHYFKVHIDDLGEGPGKLDGSAGGDSTKGRKVGKKNANTCPDHDQLHPIDPDTGAPECAACEDWYEIHIYPGVEPTPDDPEAACQAARTLAETAAPIHSVADYINGGNLQIHPPTGADAKK